MRDWDVPVIRSGLGRSATDDSSQGEAVQALEVHNVAAVVVAACVVDAAKDEHPPV